MVFLCFSHQVIIKSPYHPHIPWLSALHPQEGLTAGGQATGHDGPAGSLPLGIRLPLKKPGKMGKLGTLISGFYG